MTIKVSRFSLLKPDDLYAILRLRADVFVVEQVGFRISSEQFLEDRIPHYEMTRPAK